MKRQQEWGGREEKRGCQSQSYHASINPASQVAEPAIQLENARLAPRVQDLDATAAISCPHYMF